MMLTSTHNLWSGTTVIIVLMVALRAHSVLQNGFGQTLPTMLIESDSMVSSGGNGRILTVMLQDSQCFGVPVDTIISKIDSDTDD